MLRIKKGDEVVVISGRDKGKRGAVLYEMDGVDEQEAREALRLAASKLPLRTTFVARQLGSRQ